jgi:salicylate hydroxylase
MTQREAQPQKIVIAGGGIAGLTAALTLAQAGYAVDVLERSDVLSEVGAGLQISPNAAHVLDRIGVLDRIQKLAVAPEAIRITSGITGRTLTNLQLGDAIVKRFGAPYLVIHRADLQKALLDEVTATPSIQLTLGCTDIELDQSSPEHVVVSYRCSGSSQNVCAMAVVGADGVWSSLRQTIPGHAEARFTGRTAYRATLPTGGLDWRFMYGTGLWLGPNAHLVHYPMRGGKEFNLVAIVDNSWQEETWAVPATGKEVAKHFTRWNQSIRDLLGKPDKWIKWALCGVDAEGAWSDDRLILIGDAAHAMLPFAAQGAGMSIEDAAVLPQALANFPGAPAKAFKAFEAERKPRVAKVQETAKGNGRVYHLKGPAAMARNMALRYLGKTQLEARTDWIYSWQPTA